MMIEIISNFNFTYQYTNVLQLIQEKKIENVQQLQTRR